MHEFRLLAAIEDPLGFGEDSDSAVDCSVSVAVSALAVYPTYRASKA